MCYPNFFKYSWKYFELKNLLHLYNFFGFLPILLTALNKPLVISSGCLLSIGTTTAYLVTISIQAKPILGVGCSGIKIYLFDIQDMDPVLYNY